MTWSVVAPWRLGASQNLAIGAASAQNGTAFNQQTQALMLTPTSDCHVAIGSNPTATATSTLLKASTPYVFLIGLGDKLAVIQDAAAGTLNITELSH